MNPQMDNTDHQIERNRHVTVSDDDARLIAQFQSGEEDVFDQIVTRYRDRIYQLAWRFVDTHEDALDLTQEVFLKAYQGLPNFKCSSLFYTWLYRVAVNRCVDFTRRFEAHKRIKAHASDDDESLLMRVADPKPTSPSKAVENEELLAQIQGAIMQLSPRQREIFVLRHRQGLRLKEIAQQLGRSTGTVKAHLFQAQRNLREMLRPYLQNEPIVTPSQG